MGFWPLAMMLGVFLWLTHPTQAATTDCSAVNRVSFICGVTNVEDFAPVPGTKWLIGSDLSTPKAPQGNLYLFDTSNRSASAVPSSEIAIGRTSKPIPTALAHSTQKRSGHTGWI